MVDDQETSVEVGCHFTVDLVAIYLTTHLL